MREGGLPRRHPTRHGQEGLRRGRRLKGQGRRPVPVNFPRLGIPSLRKGYTAGCMASSTGKHAKARLPQVSDTRSIYPKYRMRVLGSPPFPGFQESVEVPAPLLWPCLAIYLAGTFPFSSGRRTKGALVGLGPCGCTAGPQVSPSCRVQGTRPGIPEREDGWPGRGGSPVSGNPRWETVLLETTGRSAGRSWRAQSGNPAEGDHSLIISGFVAAAVSSRFSPSTPPSSSQVAEKRQCRSLSLLVLSPPSEILPKRGTNLHPLGDIPPCRPCRRFRRQVPKEAP